MTPSRSQAAERALQAYESLNPVEQGVLMAVATAYRPLARSTIVTAVRACGLTRSSRGRSLNAQEILPVLDRLVRLGLLQHDQDAYDCQPAVAVAILRGAHRHRSFGSLPEALEKARVTPSDEARIRLALCQEDFAQVRRLLGRSGARDTAPPITNLTNDHFDADWIRTWPHDIVASALEPAFEHGMLMFEAVTARRAFLESLILGGCREERIVAHDRLQCRAHASLQ